MAKYCAFLLLLLFFHVGTAPAQETVKIGVLTDLSGNASYLGNETRVGALLAEKELREQGANVEVIFEDSALNTARGVAAAQKLLALDGVDAMFVDFNAIISAVSPLVERSKKVMVYASAAESIARTNKYAFKTYLDFSLGCGVLAREFLKKGISKIGVLKVEAEYGDLCLAGARKAADVIEESYRQGESVASQILKLKNKGAQAIINGCFEIDALNMLKAAGEINYRVPVGINEDGLTKKVEEQFCVSLNHSLTFGFPKLSARIVKEARAIPGGENLASFERVGLSYVHVKQMVAAASACRERGEECVAEVLGDSPVDNDVGFEGWKNHIAKTRIVVKEYSNGALTEIGSYGD